MKKIIAFFLTIVLLVSTNCVFNFTVLADTAPNLTRKSITLPEDVSTSFVERTFSAATPEVNSFMDAYSRYNVACFSNKNLYIYRYNNKLSLHSTLTITPPKKFDLRERI